MTEQEIVETFLERLPIAVLKAQFKDIVDELQTDVCEQRDAQLEVKCDLWDAIEEDPNERKTKNLVEAARWLHQVTRRYEQNLHKYRTLECLRKKYKYEEDLFKGCRWDAKTREVI